MPGRGLGKSPDLADIPAVALQALNRRIIFSIRRASNV